MNAKAIKADMEPSLLRCNARCQWSLVDDADMRRVYFVEEAEVAQDGKEVLGLFLFQLLQSTLR
jgi:hypothetical protein